MPSAPPPPSGQPFGRKPVAGRQIFSVKVVSQPDGRKPAGSVRVFCVLAARERGLAAIAELAREQHGVVHQRQLVAAGLTRARQRTLVGRGTLVPVLRGVYLVGLGDPPPLAAETAALLALAHDVVIGHHSAAAMWALATAFGPVQVTVIGRGLRRRPGVELFRVPHLHSRDVRLRHGLPVTAPARTLLDVAATATPTQLADIAGEARARGLVDDASIDGALSRAPLRTGSLALKRLRASDVGRRLTRSHLERLLLELIRDAGLPLPLTNTVVNGVEVDAAWPAHRLILECDSWAHHGDRTAFEGDRRRDQRHLAHGFLVIRITYRQLTQEPLRVAALVSRALRESLAA